jgi:hypothetical protein
MQKIFVLLLKKNFRFPGIIIITVICSGFDCISGTPNSFQVVEPINNL